MTKVAILPVPANQHGSSGMAFHAVAGNKQARGHTAGQALDALAAQLMEPRDDTLVIVQSHRPDAFFDASQQQRLAELMMRWRMAREQGGNLPPSEQQELEALVEAELRASGGRAIAFADSVTRG